MIKLDDDEYMKDPRAKTIEGFIAALQVFARYEKDGLSASYPLSAEHDIIYGGPDLGEVSQEDAELLNKLGWHTEDETDSWGYFT